MEMDGRGEGLSVLGDGTRFAIFESLAERPRAVGELAELVAALRDQLDTYWNRALSGYADLAEQQPTEEQE